MQEYWVWLYYNSTQLQTIGSLSQAVGSVAAVIVAIALAVVAWKQARAADAQAEAARAQIPTSLYIADIQTSPNISITQVVRDRRIIGGRVVILNNGFGSAKEITLAYRDPNSANEVLLANSTLVVRDSLEAVIDETRAQVSGLTLTYSTNFGTRYELDFGWDRIAHRSTNEKLRPVARRFDVPVELRKSTSQ